MDDLQPMQSSFVYLVLQSASKLNASLRRRVENRQALEVELTKITRQRSQKEWVDLLKEVH